MLSTLLLILIISPISIFSQEETVSDNIQRTFEISMGSESGTLVNNTDGIFDRNEVTFGLSYTQNFKNLEWFTLNLGLGAISFINFNNINESKDLANPKYHLDGINNLDFLLDYAQITFGFSKYLSITVRQSLLTFIYAFYPITFSPTQSLVFYGGVEFYPYKRKIDAFENSNGVKNGDTLDYIEFGFEYFVGLSKEFTYSTQVAFVSRGHAFANNGVLLYEADSPAAFLHNLEIEWDNTITYANANGFTASGTLRYLISRMGGLNIDTVDGHVNHDVVFVTSVGYAFNFTK